MSEKSDIGVLLIDDEETLVEYLSKRLLREGYTVKATFSGEEAAEVANNDDFDVVVVDLKMPGMDGVETQKRLRKIQPLSPVHCSHRSWDHRNGPGKWKGKSL